MARLVAQLVVWSVVRLEGEGSRWELQLWELEQVLVPLPRPKADSDQQMQEAKVWLCPLSSKHWCSFLLHHHHDGHHRDGDSQE